MRLKVNHFNLFAEAEWGLWGGEAALAKWDWGKGCKFYYCTVAIYNAILSKTKSDILVGCAW
jgi:hypothetical protein